MKNLKEINGLWFNENTSEEVAQIIARNYHKGRLRFWYGKEGKAWAEEYDTCGYIGRSCGTCKIPLLIPRSTSIGGGALMTDSIVKIVEIATNRVLYQHANFNQATFTSVENNEVKYPEYTYCVLSNGELYARFTTKQRADRYADFMNGKRHCK